MLAGQAAKSGRDVPGIPQGVGGGEQVRGVPGGWGQGKGGTGQRGRAPGSRSLISGPYRPAGNSPVGATWHYRRSWP